LKITSSSSKSAVDVGNNRCVRNCVSWDKKLI
jgi:hypothetical protein